MLMVIDHSFVSRVRNWACQQPELVAVVLFGSRAKGTATPESDWDICCFVASSSESWYSTWHFNAEKWKAGFCQSTGLNQQAVQFCAPTSDAVMDGLLECSKVLYVRGLGGPGLIQH